MLGALLAWEHGAGRNHVVTLRTVAEAIGDRFTFDAALCDLTHGAELKGICEPVQGPWLPISDEYRKSKGNPPIASWAEFLADVGFRRPEILRESIGWWQGVMRECDISLVIADCAPCALMAARGLGIPSIATSTAYLTPPPNMESFPLLRPEYPDCLYEEADTLGIVNSAVAAFGVPELSRLPEIYAATDQLAFSLDLLDPYAKWRERPLLPPMMGGETGSVADGEEIFVYLSNSEMAYPGLIDALCDLGAPVRAFIPNVHFGLAADLIWRGINVEADPLPPDLIARRSRLMINAAQHGTACICLASGLPQVSIPGQPEQRFTAEAVAGRGAMRHLDKADASADFFRSTILDAYEDATMAHRARDLAEELRPQFQLNQRKLIRRRIADVMDNRI